MCNQKQEKKNIGTAPVTAAKIEDKEKQEVQKNSWKFLVFAIF